MPFLDREFQRRHEQYLQNIELQRLQQEREVAAQSDPPMFYGGQTMQFEGLASRYGQVPSDLQWRIRGIFPGESSQPEPTQKVSSISHKPKGGGKARYILPNGLMHEHTGESFPEFLIIERGEGYIPNEVWDKSKIAKNRKLKFELSEILDGVYVYMLDKI